MTVRVYGCSDDLIHVMGSVGSVEDKSSHEEGVVTDKDLPKSGIEAEIEIPIDYWTWLKFTDAEGKGYLIRPIFGWTWSFEISLIGEIDNIEDCPSWSVMVRPANPSLNYETTYSATVELNAKDLHMEVLTERGD